MDSITSASGPLTRQAATDLPDTRANDLISSSLDSISPLQKEEQRVTKRRQFLHSSSVRHKRVEVQYIDLATSSLAGSDSELHERGGGKGRRCVSLLSVGTSRRYVRETGAYGVGIFAIPRWGSSTVDSC